MAGNADAIARIGWDNSDAQRGARDFLRLTDQTSKAFNKVWDGAKFGAGFLGIGSAAQAVGTVLEKVKQGFDFNAEMSDAEAGIANVLRRFDGLNRVAAKNEAAKAMQMIADLEPVTAGGLQDLVGGFMGTVAAAKAVGLTTEQNIQLVSKFANALANAGLPVDQLRQEMASILSGNITSDSQLAKILGITNEEVNAIKARGGDLFAYLTDKIGEFGEAGDSASVTFSSFESAMNKFLGAATGGAFEELLGFTRDLTGYLEENAGAAEKAGKSLGDYLYIFREYTKDINETLKENTGSSLFDYAGDFLKSTILPGRVSRPLAKVTPNVLPKEDVDLARIYDEAQKVQDQIKKLEQRAADPSLKEEARLAILEKVKNLREDELAIEFEAARLRKEEGAGLVESLRKARENIGLQEKGRGKSTEVGGLTAEQKKANEQAVKDAQSLFEQQQKLDEIRRKGLYDSLTPLEQMVMLEQEIADAQRDVALLPYTTAEDRVKREQELAQLLNERAALQGQINAEEERSTEEARKRAEAEAELALKQAESLEEYQMQMQILREQIAGHDEKAKQLERELRIQREAKMLQDQTGMSEAEALKMARERVDLEEKANQKRNNSRYDDEGRRKSDGRRKIVSERDGRTLPGESSRNRSSLDDFYEKNKPEAPRLNDTFRFPGLDEMNKRGPLRKEFKFPGLDAFEKMQNKDNPLEDKARQNNADKDQSNPTLSTAQQVIQKMDAILEKLS